MLTVAAYRTAGYALKRSLNNKFILIAKKGKRCYTISSFIYYSKNNKNKKHHNNEIFANSKRKFVLNNCLKIFNKKSDLKNSKKNINTYLISARKIIFGNNLATLALDSDEENVWQTILRQDKIDAFRALNYDNFECVPNSLMLMGISRDVAFDVAHTHQSGFTYFSIAQITNLLNIMDNNQYIYYVRDVLQGTSYRNKAIKYLTNFHNMMRPQYMTLSGIIRSDGSCDAIIYGKGNDGSTNIFDAQIQQQHNGAADVIKYFDDNKINHFHVITRRTMVWQTIYTQQRDNTFKTMIDHNSKVSQYLELMGIPFYYAQHYQQDFNLSNIKTAVNNILPTHDHNYFIRDIYHDTTNEQESISQLTKFHTMMISGNMTLGFIQKKNGNLFPIIYAKHNNDGDIYILSGETKQQWFGQNVITFMHQNNVTDFFVISRGLIWI